MEAFTEVGNRDLRRGCKSPKSLWASAAFIFLVLANSLADCVVPPVGVVGWWPGDNTVGDEAQLNPGVLYRGASYTTGLIGNAFHFDGVEGFVHVPATTSFNISNAITLEAWVKHEYFGPEVQRYVTLSPEKAQIRYDGTAGFHFSIKVAGKFYQLRPGITPKLGVFQHVAGVYSGTAQYLYIDGKLVASQAVIGPFDPATSDAVYISANGEAMAGDIDEPTIYDRALSPAEIRFFRKVCAF